MKKFGNGSQLDLVVGFGDDSEFWISYSYRTMKVHFGSSSNFAVLFLLEQVNFRRGANAAIEYLTSLQSVPKRKL